MRTLTFFVSGQTLRKEGDFSGITAGSKGYLKCRFRTDDADWKGAKKVALFNEAYPVAVNALHECCVPDAVTDGKSFKVLLVGQNRSARITTNQVLIEQVK